MKLYPINEIFQSLQGEGFFTGTASVFIRFSGCNLSCSFCDTDHISHRTFMSVDDIIKKISSFKAVHVVLTGGEPSLFADEELLSALHNEGKFIAIETNGTNLLPAQIDWITLSPKNGIKGGGNPIVEKCDELKVIYSGQDMNEYSRIAATHKFIQPCDFGNPELNKQSIKSAISFCLDNPQWRLSLQTHKFIGIR